VIRQRPDRDEIRVQVYAGRDPLTGRKRWVSRQVPGKGRATWKEAKQVEAALLAEVGAGRHRGSKAKTVAELPERWFEWRQSVRPIAPRTVDKYRRCMAWFILPALGKLAVGQVDAATLDRFYAPAPQAGRQGQSAAGAHAKRLKDLERENAALKRLLAEAELEKAALKEIAAGNI
jgi:hypothetical protein